MTTIEANGRPRAEPDGERGELFLPYLLIAPAVVIDVVARKEITKIKVGQIPKRNSTGIFPVIGTGTGTN